MEKLKTISDVVNEFDRVCQLKTTNSLSQRLIEAKAKILFNEIAEAHARQEVSHLTFLKCACYNAEWRKQHASRFSKLCVDAEEEIAASRGEALQVAKLAQSRRVQLFQNLTLTDKEHQKQVKVSRFLYRCFTACEKDVVSLSISPEAVGKLKEFINTGALSSYTSLKICGELIAMADHNKVVELPSAVKKSLLQMKFPVKGVLAFDAKGKLPGLSVDYINRWFSSCLVAKEKTLYLEKWTSAVKSAFADILACFEEISCSAAMLLRLQHLAPKKNITSLHLPKIKSGTPALISRLFPGLQTLILKEPPEKNLGKQFSVAPNVLIKDAKRGDYVCLEEDGQYQGYFARTGIQYNPKKHPRYPDGGIWFVSEWRSKCINDTTFRQMCKGSDFHELRLKACSQLTDTACQTIASTCGQLRVFKLSSDRITDQGVISVIEACRDLLILQLDDCPKLTDRTGIAISQYLPGLIDLVFNYPRLKDKAGIAIAKKCTKLRRLKFRSKHITDMTGLAVSQHCAEMRHLDLQGTGISKKSLFALLKLKSLEFLYFADCENVSITKAEYKRVSSELFSFSYNSSQIIE